MINFKPYVLKKLYDFPISTILTFLAPLGIVNMMSPFLAPNEYMETNKLVTVIS